MANPLHHDPRPAPAGQGNDDRDLVAALYRAFSDGNPDLLDVILADDWQDIPLAPGQQPGRAGMKPLILAFSAAFSDLRITIVDTICQPGRVAVRAVISGTHTGPWFGVAPTGRPFQIAIHEFHAIADGRVTHTWHLEDWFGWLGQIGAWPVAAAEVGS